MMQSSVEFDHLAEVILKGYGAVIICESRSDMAKDALKLKNI